MRKSIRIFICGSGAIVDHHTQRLKKDPSATQKLLLHYENCDPDELITHCVGAVMRGGCEKIGNSDALVTLQSLRKESPP